MSSAMPSTALSAEGLGAVSGRVFRWVGGVSSFPWDSSGEAAGWLRPFAAARPVPRFDGCSRDGLILFVFRLVVRFAANSSPHSYAVQLGFRHAACVCGRRWCESARPREPLDYPHLIFRPRGPAEAASTSWRVSWRPRSGIIGFGSPHPTNHAPGDPTHGVLGPGFSV